MLKQHKIYQLLLRLYPKSFRDQYGTEMLVTLDDLLQAETDRLGRLSVWLRVSAEFPLSVAHENINNLGGHNMEHLSFIANKKLIAGVLFLGILLFVIFGRTWIHSEALPAVVGAFYQPGIVQSLKSEGTASGDPFQSIGNTSTNPQYECSTLPSPGISIRLSCRAYESLYVVLGQDSTDKQRILAAAAKVKTQLQANGFEAGDNGVTVQSLIDGTYEGKDYSPDAAYMKTIGDKICTFDTAIAYSNPRTPAIIMQMYCTQAIKFL